MMIKLNYFIINIKIDNYVFKNKYLSIKKIIYDI